MNEGGYQILEIQLDKVVQLYETLLTRHTTMVVGPTGGGKTLALGTMCRAQVIAGLPTKQFVINPKAIPISELYGMLDPATRDWTDGLLSNIFRDMNKPVAEGKEERRYIVYDGDVDAVWVENMNSVMDDNKLLTLPNGERIRLNFPTCSMLFEVFDLQYASPATISRCGMVYVDPEDIGWKPYLWKWLNTRPPAEQEVLRPLTDKYLEKCVDYVMDGIWNKVNKGVRAVPRGHTHTRRGNSGAALRARDHGAIDATQRMPCTPLHSCCYEGWIDGAPRFGWEDTLAYLSIPLILVCTQTLSLYLLGSFEALEAAEDSQSQTAGAVLRLLPFMLGWFAMNAPAGLGLYWVFNNILTTATTVTVKKLVELIEGEMLEGVSGATPSASDRPRHCASAPP